MAKKKRAQAKRRKSREISFALPKDAVDRKVQLRQSGASGTHQDRRLRRKRTRGDRTRDAIREQDA